MLSSKSQASLMIKKPQPTPPQAAAAAATILSLFLSFFLSLFSLVQTERRGVGVGVISKWRERGRVGVGCSWVRELVEIAGFVNYTIALDLKGYISTLPLPLPLPLGAGFRYPLLGTGTTVQFSPRLGENLHLGLYFIFFLFCFLFVFFFSFGFFLLFFFLSHQQTFLRHPHDSFFFFFYCSQFSIKGLGKTC